MRIRINDEQRDISYGELVALQQEFEAQLDENGVIFDDDESYEQALGDFIQQYIDGDDNPMIDLSTANVRPVRDSKRRRVRDDYKRGKHGEMLYTSNDIRAEYTVYSDYEELETLDNEAAAVKYAKQIFKETGEYTYVNVSKCVWTSEDEE